MTITKEEMDLIKKLAKDGKICEIYGHKITHTYQVDIMPPVQYGECLICVKEFTYNPGGWQ